MHPFRSHIIWVEILLDVFVPSGFRISGKRVCTSEHSKTKVAEMLKQHRSHSVTHAGTLKHNSCEVLQLIYFIVLCVCVYTSVQFHVLYLRSCSPSVLRWGLLLTCNSPTGLHWLSSESSIYLPLPPQH